MNVHTICTRTEEEQASKLYKTVLSFCRQELPTSKFRLRRHQHADINFVHDS